MEEASSSSHSSLGDASTVQVQTAQDKGLRGLHKVYKYDHMQYQAQHSKH